MRFFVIAAAACEARLILKKQDNSFMPPPPVPAKGDWVKRCEALSGLVTPYYTAKEGDQTTVGCVPALCGQKLGRSTDMAAGDAAAAKCTWDKMEDTCCTDKIANPCTSGSLPCVLGKVETVEVYNSAAVPQFEEKDAQAVMKDCDGKAGGAGPVADFEAKADTATGKQP